MKKADFETALSEKKSHYERLRSSAEEILSKILSENFVPCLPIQSRIKTVSSAGNKFQSKGYSAPFEQMTDIVGLRVVVFLERDIDKVERLTRECFQIDEANSVDKRRGSKVNQVGYRSLHLICHLGMERAQFPEYKGLTDTVFEIQIRTALENTWAEIEHKQNYKSSKSLPDDLQRRLNIISGSLELIDRELSNIVQDAETYSESLLNSQSDVGSDPLSETSVRAVAFKVAEQRKLIIRDAHGSIAELVDELRDFGVQSNFELENLISNSPVSRLLSREDEETTIFGFIREAMMFKDPEKFFGEAFHGQFALSEDELKEIAELSGNDKVWDLVIKNGGAIFDY